MSVRPEPMVTDGVPPKELRGRRTLGWLDARGVLARKESLEGRVCQNGRPMQSNKKKTHTRLLIDVQKLLMSDRDGSRKLSCGGNIVRRSDQPRAKKTAKHDDH